MQDFQTSKDQNAERLSEPMVLQEAKERGYAK